MPTKNINLPDQLADFVDDSVRTGRFQNASEVVRAGLRLLAQQESESAARLEALRRAAQEGIDAIDRGDYITLDRDGIDQFMRSLDEKLRRGSSAK